MSGTRPGPKRYAIDYWFTENQTNQPDRCDFFDEGDRLPLLSEIVGRDMALPGNPPRTVGKAILWRRPEGRADWVGAERGDAEG